MVLLTVPVLSQDRQGLPDTPRHTLGLEYSSNYIGNMGSISYSYNFNSSISTYMNNGIGYLGLSQDANGEFPTVNGARGTDGTISVFMKHQLDIGLGFHFYKLNRFGFFRTAQIGLAHIFVDFSHKYKTVSPDLSVTGEKKYSLWGLAFAFDIYEYRFLERLSGNFGIKGHIYFLPSPQTLRYTDNLGGSFEDQLFSGSGSTLMFIYPELYMTVKQSF